MDDIAFLKSTDLLAGVSEAGLREIRASMEETRIPAGAAIFHQGDAGDAVYVVLQGTLRLERDGLTLVTRGRGFWVGEFALVDNQPRSMSAVAESDLTLLKWARDAFLSVLSHRSEVAFGVVKVLTGKLRDDIEVQTELAVERERWRQDLKRAREIQMGMLPSGELSTPFLELAGHCRPAAEVGGDYYDYLRLDDDRLGVIIVDVTGHGFYAGLFVAMAKSGLNAQARVNPSPPNVMEAMQETLTLSIQRSLLMSCCYVLLDPRRQCFGFVNAGHPYPYHYRANEKRLDRLAATDPILGVQDLYESSYETSERPWMPGDLLVVYSDGITEARNSDGLMFGNERLEQCILDNRQQPATEIRDESLRALADHLAGGQCDDDLTLVVARAL